MYDKVSKDLNFVDREKEVLSFWQERKIFEKSIEARSGAPVFTFYDGPPTANGKPHIGHILTRAIKDSIPRYKTMKGYRVLRKAGWDTHGLPVELEVERSLGISGKPDIEKYGVEPFIKKCKESVWRYEAEWREMSDRVGFWADMEQPYVTYHNDYIESVWWALKKIWDKDLLYKGHRVVPYCPRCGTSLSSHEVAQGYKDVSEQSVYVKFKLVGKENEYFLAWTTTPWTLPANLGLVVNARETYAKVLFNGEYYILAEALLATVLGEDYEITARYTGAELENTKYEPLYAFAQTDGAFYVVSDNYVTLSDGTGIVHMAPAFGEDDARVGGRYGFPFFQPVNEQGRFADVVTPWAGLFVKDADPLIIEDLRASGKLFRAATYEHSYPFCWRCDTPLLYYAREAWFIRMTALRDRLVANNNTVCWYPESIKTGRFGNFLENVIDWGLSRERYWGTPLPIWECACGHKHAVGSIAELSEFGGDVPEGLELHKPYIDRILLDCPKCGAKMKRVPEVIDCWFDSGAMPFAQWHYPFENKAIFDENFPAQFISEAVDQTRGWFYTLMAISTLVFDRSPYENVVVLGHVQDKDGQKMSKHKGNVVDPWTVLDKQGADAIRWYFYTASAPWLPNRFSEESVNEGQRKFMGTLWNTYAFYVLYAEIDGFDPTAHRLAEERLNVMDRWILSRLNTLIQTVDEGLAAYKLTESARAMNDFVDELSNWYVRRSRERFWVSGMPEDKVNAYMTLFTVLETMTRLSAPFTPFLAEAIYANLVKSVDKSAPESVHLCDFPVAAKDRIDPELEKYMAVALDAVVAGRAARNTANIKNRQPIGRMYLKTDGRDIPALYLSVIADELNVKDVCVTDDVAAFTTYRFKPQLKTLGPKYGKAVPKIAEKLKEADGNALMAQFKAGAVSLDVDGAAVTLTLEDVLVESAQQEGFAAESGKMVTAVIDTRLTPDLVEEGFVREIISKIQTMRKEADFEVLDKIACTYTAGDVLSGVFERNRAEIQKETLAEAAVLAKPEGFVKEWDINGEKAQIGVRRLG